MSDGFALAFAGTPTAESGSSGDTWGFRLETVERRGLPELCDECARELRTL